MQVGSDSWAPPTQAILDVLKLVQGFSFFGGYVGGADLYLNTPWPIEGWQLLKNNGLKPLPIWVPKQDCSEDPMMQAHAAMQAVEANDMVGLVALDTEHSMSLILNYQAWIDSFVDTVDAAGWFCVSYDGAHYYPSKAYNWFVEWGEHQDVPSPGQAIQYGPYVLHDTTGKQLGTLDGDSAADDFPFAQWRTNEQPEVKPVTDTTPNQPPDSQPEKDATGKLTLSAPIVASIMLPNRQGSYMVGADGAVYPRGNAPFHGALTEQKIELHAPIIAIECVDTQGYTLVAADGGRFPFGNQPNFGAL